MGFANNKYELFFIFLEKVENFDVRLGINIINENSDVLTAGDFE